MNPAPPMQLTPEKPAAPVCEAWFKAPVGERIAWAGRFRRLVAHHQSELCTLMQEETGKTLQEALFADLAPLLAAIGWVESRAAGLLKPRRQGGGPWWLGRVKVVKRREPVGTVAIIATWNYPVQLLGIQLVHALVAGNTVTVKPSENAPRTQSLLLTLALESGLPRGTLTVLPATREAGESILRSHTFDHVVFTGSTGVGRGIAQALAGSLTPATLELSGRDSALVLEDADPKLAARCIWTAMTVNAGQTCMGPRRALVHESVYPQFASEISKLAAKARPRNVINEAAANRCYELAQAALRAGARDATGTLAEPLGRLVRPTAVLDCRAEHEVVQGDHFGPLLAVVPVANLREMLAVHRSVGQHLVTSVFTGDKSRGRDLASELDSGIVMINDAMVPTGHPAVGLGGRGASGIGVSRGEEGLLAMTHPVWVTESNGLIRRMTMNMSPSMVRMTGRFLGWWYGGSSRDRSPIAPTPAGTSAAILPLPAVRAAPEAAPVRSATRIEEPSLPEPRTGAEALPVVPLDADLKPVLASVLQAATMHASERDLTSGSSSA